ncbi:tetrahydromethanopterin S-methyltransferase subunit G [Mucilaginibacter sp. UYP25]|uniref:hypothetical protein n=1 Tax=unclassified Mucilaginibacter TaxID=2617802 RepID=UPI00339976AD
MFKKNNICIGFLYGCVAPVLAWLIFAVLLKNDAIIMDKPAAPYLIAVLLNLVALRFAARAHLDKIAYGIMIATFACTLLVFVFKMHG